MFLVDTDIEAATVFTKRLSKGHIQYTLPSDLQNLPSIHLGRMKAGFPGTLYKLYDARIVEWNDSTTTMKMGQISVVDKIDRYPTWV
tara:strand:- start:1257 stop:1517 length:261 start_codon:yes stop_codon:yes gene_type:complete